MRLWLQFAGASLVCTSLSCSDAEQTPLPSGTAGNAAAGTAGSGVAGSNAAGTSSGGATAGSSAGGAATQAGNMSGGTGTGGASGGAGSGGAAGNGGLGGAGGMLSSDPGTRAFQIHCLMCHGEQGVGTILGPEVQHPVRDYSTWVVRNGLPGVGFTKPMEIIPPEMLTDADLTLIYEYLDKPPQPTTAEGLYKDYCGNCHGADGKGGPTTRDITGADVEPIEEVVRQGTHLGMFDERNEYMPAYSTTLVSDAELQLISDYVDTL